MQKADHVQAVQENEKLLLVCEVRSFIDFIHWKRMIELGTARISTSVRDRPFHQSDAGPMLPVRGITGTIQIGGGTYTSAGPSWYLALMCTISSLRDFKLFFVLRCSSYSMTFLRLMRDPLPTQSNSDMGRAGTDLWAVVLPDQSCCYARVVSIVMRT